MSIRKKLLIIPFLFIVLISTISIIYYNHSNSNELLLKQIYDENFIAVVEIADAHNDIITAESIAKELSILAMLGEDPDKITAHANEGLAKISSAESIIKKYSAETEKLEKAFDAYIKVYKKIIKSCAEDLDSYSASQLHPELEKYYEIIASVTDSEVNSQKALVRDTYNSLVAKNDSDFFWFYAISIVGILLSIALVLVISAKILGRIHNISSMLKNIAEGDGDLTKRIDSHAHDELGALAASFNKFIENMHSIITELASSVGQLVTATHNMSEQSKKTNSSMTKQMDKVEHVNLAMTEMSNAVDEVSSNIVEAVSNADVAENATKSGQASFSTAIEIIKALANNVRQASEVIVRLKEDSTSIGGILEVIRGIAEQTNLLALNAAIEAARAGEQGRGFAVVADEVRTLATRTQQSTEEIHNMIESLQEASEQASKVMEHGLLLSEDCEQKTQGAFENMEKASNAVISMNETNIQVATAAEEQSEVAEGIKTDISDISTLSQETSDTANSVAASGQELSQLSMALQTIINRYKY